MGLRPLQIFQILQYGDRLYTSEYDVYRRQVLAYKDGPRAGRAIKIRWTFYNATI